MVLENAEYKKKYSAPCVEIEMFTITDVISTSGSQDDYEDDDDIFGKNNNGGAGARAFNTWDGEF